MTGHARGNPTIDPTKPAGPTDQTGDGAPPGWAVNEGESEGTDPVKVSWRRRMWGLVYSVVTPKTESPWLQNMAYLDQRVCRGARPHGRGIDVLREMGIDTVINLRGEHRDESRELCERVQAAGMRYLFFPLSPVVPASHDQARMILQAICDPANGQVYLHCYHGADRTGVFSALYRVTRQGWSLPDALAEMSNFGFHYSIQSANWAFVANYASIWLDLSPEEREGMLQPGQAIAGQSGQPLNENLPNPN